MTDRINISDQLNELCAILGLEPRYVASLTIEPSEAVATVYRRHPVHGGKFIVDDKAVVETQTFRVKT